MSVVVGSVGTSVFVSVSVVRWCCPYWFDGGVGGGIDSGASLCFGVGVGVGGDIGVGVGVGDSVGVCVGVGVRGDVVVVRWWCSRWFVGGGGGGGGR